MYTTHCEDSDCENCRYWKQSGISEVIMKAAKKQAARPIALSPEEENQAEFVRTIQKSVRNNLLEANDEKESYLKSFKKAKDEIHDHIGRLIEALRERERELCCEVDQACRNEMERINCFATFKAFDNLLKRSLPEIPPYRPVFKCDHGFISSEIKKFGRVSYQPANSLEESYIKPLTGNEVASFALLLDTPFESATMPESRVPIGNEDGLKRLENFEILNDLQKCATKTESQVPIGNENGLKRLDNLEILKDLQISARKTESLVPIGNEGGLKRLDNLEILNDLQKCARETEKFKALANKAQQFEECLDCNDSSIATEREQLENLSKICQNQRRQLEEATNVVSCNKVGKNSSKLKEHRESYNGLRKSLLQLQLNCLSGLELNREELMNENLENLYKSVKKESQYFEEMKDSACDTEFRNDDSSDEDDMEIISQSEAATIPSEMPALPPKNRFRFGRKRTWCPSLYSRKPAVPKEANSAPERSTLEVKPQEVITAFSQLMQRTNKQAYQEPISKCIANPESCNINDSEGIKGIDSTAPISTVECKEIPSLLYEQEPSSECLGASNDEGQGRGPSEALASSFKRYLEKDPESKWLVNGKSSEQFLPGGNGSIFKEELSFLKDNVRQWLSVKEKQDLISDWLYEAHM